MDTPVHIKLWHRDFWLLAVASLLLTMSVYVLLPVLPHWLMRVENFSAEETGLLMGAFGVGLYIFGFHCSWLVQHYRRNVVCIWAIIFIALDTALLWYIDGLRSEFVSFGIILVQRLLLGATFGLAQMVLSSTLIIDTCESFQRTEANYSVSWFSRFALSLGPITGVLVMGFYDFDAVLWVSMGLAVLAMLLVKTVNFPFRTPDEQLHFVSLDRFFLPHGFALFVNFLLVSTVVGLLLSVSHEPLFYGLLMGGFLLSLLAQRFVFQEAEQKSEILSGLIVMIASLLILFVYPESPVSPLLIGLGIGIVASRFQLFFIKLSRHCQRGTSQSTYFLGWETGLALGLAYGYGICYQQPSTLLLYIALGLTAAALLMYHFFTHSWFVRNKNR